MPKSADLYRTSQAELAEARDDMEKLRQGCVDSGRREEDGSKELSRLRKVMPHEHMCQHGTANPGYLLCSPGLLLPLASALVRASLLV